MKIFVTGATGFIGSHLTRRLNKLGYKVTAYVRKGSCLKYLPKKGIKIAYGDIKDADCLCKTVKGFDVVFHNAGLVSDWAKKDAFYQTNLEGTKNILKAIKNNNIKRLFVTSTTAVLGEENCLLAKNEDSPYRPRINYSFSSLFESGMNHYRISKMLAEKEAIKFCQKYHIDLTVIRPTWVYGPREFGAGPFSFCKAVLDGVPLLPIGKTNRFHVVYVEDLITAFVLALEKNLTGVNIFIIGSLKAPLLRQYLTLFCRNLNKKMPQTLPEIFFQPLGLSLEAIYKLFGIKQAPLLTRARIKMFYCNNIYDTSNACEKLNFSAATPLETGIKKTVRWWKLNKYL